MSLDYCVRRSTDIVPNPWQATRRAEDFLDQHHRKGYDGSKLLNQRGYLLEVLIRRVKKDIDAKAEAVLRDKAARDEVRFRLETDERLNYELGRSFEVFAAKEKRTLQGEHGRQIQRSLFEPLFESGSNSLEKDFTLYLEKSKALYWWHRIAARQDSYLQGWRRQRVYPDFVVCRREDGELLILETKGLHLRGSDDTGHKKKLLATLEDAYSAALERGPIQFHGPPAPFRMMFEASRKEQIHERVKDSQSR